MAFEYSITHEKSYVEVNVRGEGDYLSTDKMWKDVAASCQKNNCRNILGIANISVHSTERAYDHAPIFEAAGLTSEYRIAWVERNQDVVEQTRLVETILRNRGLADGRVFDDVAEAKRWLAEKLGDH